MINFPKLNVSSIKAIRLLFIIITLILITYYLANFSLVSAISFSSLLVLLGLILMSIFRRVEYHKFLRNIGKSVDRKTFHEKEYTMSVIPFNNRSVACCARINNETLLFGRANVYRAVELSAIENIDLKNYYGHQIARVVLLNENHAHKTIFYIPWSDLLESDFNSTKI